MGWSSQSKIGIRVRARVWVPLHSKQGNTLDLNPCRIRRHSDPETVAVPFCGRGKTVTHTTTRKNSPALWMLINTCRLFFRFQKKSPAASLISKKKQAVSASCICLPFEALMLDALGESTPPPPFWRCLWRWLLFYRQRGAHLLSHQTMEQIKRVF